MPTPNRMSKADWTAYDNSVGQHRAQVAASQAATAGMSLEQMKARQDELEKLVAAAPHNSDERKKLSRELCQIEDTIFEIEG